MTALRAMISGFFISGSPAADLSPREIPVSCAASGGMEQIMSRGRQFRDLLRRGGPCIAPGAHHFITAPSIAPAGVGALYMTLARTAGTPRHAGYTVVAQSPMA